MTTITPNSLINPTEKTIKNWNCAFIAVEGPNVIDKLSLEDLAIPYESQYRSRIILKAGETNVPLIYGFIGKAVTFLMIKVTYDSINDPYYQYEQEKYNITYYFENDHMLKPLNRLMILTGSEENKIPQIYLNNPLDYDVTLDILHATVDSEYNDYFDTSENIVLNSEISATEPSGITYSGIITTVTYGENINIGDVLYVSGNTNVYVANALYDYTLPVMYLALESGSNGEIKHVLLNGFVNYYDWNFQVGKLIYCSTTNGLMTQNLDDLNIGDFVQNIGNVIKDKTIYFNPNFNISQKQ